MVDIAGFKPIPQETRDAVIALWIEGETEREIAARTKVAKSTVHVILHGDDAKAEQKRIGDDMLRKAYVKAVKVMNEQLDDPNPWVRQNAARSIIQSVQQQEAAKDNTINVTFAGMAAPALPEDSPVKAEGDVR